MQYVQNLIELIDGQIDKFITKVMMPQSDASDLIVDEETGKKELRRTKELAGLGPKYFKSDNTTMLVSHGNPGDSDYLFTNNNPYYWPNMIDRLNTPFDHLERILLQDFSDNLEIGTKADGKESNFFTNTVGMTATEVPQFSKCGFEKIEIKDKDENQLYALDGQLFLDSFTYTPFIDYSQVNEGGDNRVGVYSDKFLTEYNMGVFDDPNNTNQVDVNRRKLTSNIFKLRNLAKDIYDAKIAFRNAIDRDNKRAETDAKVYIYTFCEHLATLFAKLSNIRMSYIIYGFKHPHAEWEGILALDIWYQMLYHGIDDGYPFDDNNLEMNPMLKLKVQHDELGEYVKYWGENKLYKHEKTTNPTPDDEEQDYVEWMDDEVGAGYALVWDNRLWKKYRDTAKEIAKTRRDCVTPRGVLSKIYELVNGSSPEIPEQIHAVSQDTDDFDWFKQKGKVYSDKDKSQFSIYSNLHLGLAYEKIPAKEYFEKVLHRGELGVNPPEAGYVKDLLQTEEKDHQLLKQRMIDSGYDALYDAFQVIKNEKLFNIFNSKDNKVEEFNEDNVHHYSQSQCAIVIERVFSRLYKYLQFKSTTGELFQRHINIDSGYKYLDSESVMRSDNADSSTYFKDDDNVPYLRYLAKLNQYVVGNDQVLTDAERTVLGKFIKVLSKQPSSWLKDNWDLCPLCKSISRERQELTKRSFSKLVKRDDDDDYIDDDDIPEDYTDDGEDNLENPEDISNFEDEFGIVENEDEEPQEPPEPDVTRTVVFDFKLGSFMQWNMSDIESRSGVQVQQDGSGRPSRFVWVSTMPDSQYVLEFNEISRMIVNPPSFSTQDGYTVKYTLLGFSQTRNADIPTYSASSFITANDFPLGLDGETSQTTLTLYAVWQTQYIVRFSPGEIGATGTMQPIVVSGNTLTKLQDCQYVPGEDSPTRGVFTYFENELWDSSRIKIMNEYSPRVSVYQFDHWEYAIGGRVVRVSNGGYINLPKETTSAPVITLVAKWDVGFHKVQFLVFGEKYCDVLVSKADPRVICPEENPILTDSNMRFRSWDRVDGDSLSELEQGQMAIVWGDCNCQEHVQVETGEVICDDQTELIVCTDEEVNSGMVVNANISDIMSTHFNVRFTYLDDAGAETFIDVEVPQNAIVPSFHIHQDIPFDEGGKNYKYVFRHWRVKSGNITSSLTILSDCELVGVYDKVEVNKAYEPEFPHEEQNKVLDQMSQSLASELQNADCEYISSKGGMDGRYYCKYKGIPPRFGNQSEDEKPFELDCPYAKILLAGLDRENPESDFAAMTLLEISDVANLLKALFKVNVDIAHKEYYLKVDVPEPSDWWYGYKEKRETATRWISFEPSVEYKFSNFHAANQVLDNGRLACAFFHEDGRDEEGNPNNLTPWSFFLQPINQELKFDTNSVHYNDLYYFYDYYNSRKRTFSSDESISVDGGLGGGPRFYEVQALSLFKKTDIQSPVAANRFIKTRLYEIVRNNYKQVKTFYAMVKKYRPLVMPNVRDIFNVCVNDNTKYDADVNNDYGVFGWCTIPSKTMVNMEYNEQAIIVPSSYDHHNRIGGNNFLQMDNDLERIYKKWVGDKETGHLVQNAKNTWYYLYNHRDWTYFLLPFFNVKQNSELYSFMLDTYGKDQCPENSNHINGVIFEQSNEGRKVDVTFGDIVNTCEFLAKRHHNENNLLTLSERYTNMISFSKLKELTIGDEGEYNSKYGSQYPNRMQEILWANDGTASYPSNPWIPDEDWIDDYDKTGSYIDLKVGDYNPESSDQQFKYRFNIGQSHAIDDFDEDSVWFYITMVSPLEELNQVIELEDIMPFVFWWENRGKDNNGPTVDCYGLQSSSKLNYEEGGWCYSNAIEHNKTTVTADQEVLSTGEQQGEHRWHAVQHTIGTDFSKQEYGGTILTTDNSGNVYKGAFDPNCSGMDERWKIHHPSNSFGADQHEDPTADKYHLGYKAHGEGDFQRSCVPDGLNTTILESLNDRPMTWNLWNVIRHYAYLKYFKNMHRRLGSEEAAWQELENMTKKIVKSIYRTFQQNKHSRNGEGSVETRSTFNDIDGSPTNYGSQCNVYWTNSFAEISTILERNAREHQASFVLFTGDERKLDEDEAWSLYCDKLHFAADVPPKTQRELCACVELYDRIRASEHNFRVLTLDGVDEDDDGMRPRKFDEESGRYVWDKPEYFQTSGNGPVSVYQGFKFGDLPSTYVIGDSAIYSQLYPEVTVKFSDVFDFDKEYPEAEYYKDDQLQKWIRKIRQTVINRQLFPVYTSMEGMETSVHDLTVEQMKGITFQIIPQFYWKYEWTFNEFMIHRVGKLKSPSSEIELYDMLGNVWEWVRDDWSSHVNESINPGGPTFDEDNRARLQWEREHANDDPPQTYDETSNSAKNPIVGKREPEDRPEKVIKGGAFDQLCRKTISPEREGLTWDQFKSKFGTQANVGFRPSMVFTAEDEGGFTFGEPIDLFFLFDASASQDNQIGQMLESAKNIVKMFAGTEKNKDACHVGSAMFLGPTVRFMCCKKCTHGLQKIWFTYTRSEVTGWSRKDKGAVNVYKLLNYPNNFPWSYNPPLALYYDDWLAAPNDKGKKNLINGRHDWIRSSATWNYTFSYSDWAWIDELVFNSPWDWFNKTGADGNASGFWAKFKDYRDNVWMSQANSQAAQRSIIDIDDEQLEIVSWDSASSMKDDGTIEKALDEFSEPVNMDGMLMTRDGPGNTGGVSCFVAGTKIRTKGGFANIEDIRVGDMVLSYDERTGEKVYSEVIDTMVHDVQENIYDICVGNEHVESTGIHPFLTVRDYCWTWVYASDLRAGDLVMLADGKTRAIDGITPTFKGTRVYNLEVSDVHNYYVGDVGILVHNKGGCFIAGTKVALADGTEKNIEDMKVGDIVLSYNEETDENEPSLVSQTMVHDVDEDIYTITIEGDELDVTGIHKFWIMRGADKKWIPASELVVGDLVMFSDRSLHPISKIDVQKLSTGVFNIEVTKNHNYYVGRKHVLAHNKECFLAGTKVLMADGTKKPIETIQAGEVVLTYDTKLGMNVPGKVLNTMRHVVEREIITLSVCGDKIEATGIHQFYVMKPTGNVWVHASDLNIGDYVLFADGTWHELEGVNMDVRLLRVYNLHVADNHNYYVGDNGILAHNKGDGPTYYPSEYTHTMYFDSRGKRYHIFCGVPAWQTGNGDDAILHFGEIPKKKDLDEDTTSDWGRYFPASGDKTSDEVGREMFSGKYNFFTYDPTEEGVKTFEWPFFFDPNKPDNYKGVLANWFAGCEPVCNIVSRLLQYNFFYGYPYNDGLGYLFRKNTPRLLFVFTNEYDNQMTRTYTKSTGTAAHEAYLLPTANKETVQFVSKSLGSDQNAPDPYCMQILRGASSPAKLRTYIDNIGLSETDYGIDTALDGAEWLCSETGANMCNIAKLKYTSPVGHKMNLNSKWGFSDSQTIKCALSGGNDIQGMSKPLGGWDPRQVLTDYQQNYVKQYRKFPGVSYGAPDKDNIISSTSYNYDALKTTGFYQLRHTLVNLKDSVNTYLFVSDANSPTCLYETKHPDYDQTWPEEVLEDVANSIFLGNDNRLFKDIDSALLPERISNEIRNNSGVKIAKNAEETAQRQGYYNEESNRFTWKMLRLLCSYYHGNRTQNQEYLDVDYGLAQSMKVIFGLENPYERTTIVFARRPRFSLITGLSHFKKSWDKSVDYIQEKWKEKDEKDNTQWMQYYPYILGIPISGIVHTAKNTTYKKDADDFRSWMVKWIVGNVWASARKIGESENDVTYSQWNKNDTNNIEAMALKSGSYPSNWFECIHKYATEGVYDTGVYHGEESPIPLEGQKWIDKHLSPYLLYKNGTRKKNNKMVMTNLTNENCYLVGIEFRRLKSNKYDDDGSTISGEYKYSKRGLHTTWQPAPIEQVYSSESFCVRRDFLRNDSLVWTRAPQSYVTVTYKKTDERGELVTTGTLKVIVLNEQIGKSSQSEIGGSTVLLNSEKVIGVTSNPGRKLWLQLMKTKPTGYPECWKQAVICSGNMNPDWGNFGLNSYDKELAKKFWKRAAIVKFVKRFYESIQAALPILLGYRFQNQIFDQYTNKLGKSVTDYGDDENTIVCKSIPIMDVTALGEMFRDSFKGGQFNGGHNFTYGHCVVDLNPEINSAGDQYVNSNYRGLSPSMNKFPMVFKDGVNVNTDEYKTSKILLTRIDAISGDNNDTYFMGRKKSDYDEVTDPSRIKYRDEESIVAGSEDDHAKVNLTNGGSYQKDEELYQIKVLDENGQPIKRQKLGTDGTLIDVTDENGNVLYQMKYRKNKHFFIDPFELTIAQWCYVYLPDWRTRVDVWKESDTDARHDDSWWTWDKNIARKGLEPNLKQIEKSYWNYLIAWENDEWNQEKTSWIESHMDDAEVQAYIAKWMEKNERDLANETQEMYVERADRAALDNSIGIPDDIWVSRFIQEERYNPLTDTRPYYYASYRKVRGVTPTYCDVPGSSGSEYVIDSQKGDEFQLVKESEKKMDANFSFWKSPYPETYPDNISFMDILNTKVAFKTRRRIYIDDAQDGGRFLDETNMTRQDFKIDDNGNPVFKNVDIPESDYSQLGLVYYDRDKLLLDEEGSRPVDSDGNEIVYEGNHLHVQPLGKSQRKNFWCSGEIGGINFDLPTEAQWEYCCRLSSQTAFPVSNNLGLNFEERNESLDLIAWYKYKVIGTLPEPERYCTWRISKLMFGIMKDKEQINNVYETEEQASKTWTT